MSRITNKKKIINSLEMYRPLFEDRGVNHIKHYGTPEMSYPTAEELQFVDTTTHIWSKGDKLFKLAYEFYGDPKYWYIIAWFNKKPTEAHFKYGTVVFIPEPLSLVMSLFKDRR